MTIAYEKDILGWANEQARLLRAGRFDLLDLKNLAEEIEDVGKSEKRELKNRMAVLLANLLKWKYQPERQGASWQRTIKEQRKGVKRSIEETPSRKASLNEISWWSAVWSDAVIQVATETGLSDFPEECPWTLDEILENRFWLI